MSKMIKWPSIEQYRNLVKNVQMKNRYRGKDADGEPIFDAFAKLPTLKFEGTVKLHGCVHADTLITLADGSKEMIKDIVSGTSVLSYNERSQQIEFDVVNEVIVQILDKPWVELTFDNGTILKCTADHPILTTDGWVEAKYISENHVLVTENGKQKITIRQLE